MKSLLSLAAAALVFVGAPASAHHSAAMFDHSRVVILTGTLKTISYQAPHCWVSIIGAPQGVAEIHQWDAETGSPSGLHAMGVNPETLKPGDKVTVGIYPLRDGRSAGALVYIINAQGRVFGTKPTENGAVGGG